MLFCGIAFGAACGGGQSDPANSGDDESTAGETGSGGGTSMTGGAAGSGGSPGLGGSAGTRGADGGAGGAASGGMPSAGAGGATAGAAGSGSAGMRGQPFVPDISYDYVGMGSNAGVEIVAATITHDSLDLPFVLLKLGMTGPDPVCIITVPVEFLDASGAVLGDADVVIDSPMYMSFGDPIQCLGAGDIGMGGAPISIPDADMPRIASARYGLSGNIDPDGTRITGITVEDVRIADFSDENDQVTGRVVNGGAITFQDPQIHFYPVDPAGRPLAQSFDIELVPLPAGGSWSFMMYVPHPVNEYAAIPEFDSN